MGGPMGNGNVSDDLDASCELGFSPNVSLIPTVRRFVEEFYVRAIRSPNVTSRLVVATHEMLENAVRYSTDGRSLIRIAVNRSRNRCRASITTQNRASAEDRAALAKMLDELKSSRDRASAYQ